jgi:DNA polymerase V
MRPITDWHNAVAHIDADSFYAACEQLRHPELRDRPVCVLSNQNAFVVAKTYDAKARGVTTGMRVRDAKKLVPNAAFLPPDFRYYGQLSQRMFSILHRYSPEVEVYSIDEAFMDMNGLRGLFHKGFRRIADDIRQAVRSEIGITVSIGVSCTKTLAKIASESNKPDGTTVIPGRRIGRFLADIPVSDIPGIGRNRTALLAKFSIRTALEFADQGQHTIDRLLGKLGTGLWHELNGTPVYGVVTEQPLPKSVARTSAMGEVTTERARIMAWLAHHAHQLVSELVARKILAQRISVFLQTTSFEQTTIEIRLANPTNSIRRIMEAVGQACRALYEPGTMYRGTGVVATHIVAEHSATSDLFGEMDMDRKQRELMLVMNGINRRFGNHAVTSAQASTLGRRRPGEVRFRYPLFTAR